MHNLWYNMWYLLTNSISMVFCHVMIHGMMNKWQWQWHIIYDTEPVSFDHEKIFSTDYTQNQPCLSED
jgi:TRAP-type C4-dicarboxylate transport system permease small subunit